MRRWQADREATENGKKIRNCWGKDEYIYWDSGCYKDEKGMPSMDDFIDSDIDGWEIYEEPKPKKKLYKFDIICKDTSIGGYGWYDFNGGLMEDELDKFKIGDSYEHSIFVDNKIVHVKCEEIEIQDE